MTRAVLFDLYETLVRADWAALNAGRAELAARAGVDPALLREQWECTLDQRSLGTLGGLERELAAMLAACGAPADDRLLRELAALEYATWRQGVHLYQDSLPCLRRLRRRGFGVAIVSNCSREAGAVVEALGLQREVDAVLLSCEVGVTKPDPSIFRLALGRLGAPPERALVVDDRRENLEAARGLGLRTALITRGGVGAVEGEPADHPRIADLAGLWRLLPGRAA